MDNVFDESYALIDEFVSISENLRLKTGTGKYSTLFRGTLFDSTETTNVVKCLKNQQVKALWMGSNPNVPDSLKLITSGEDGGHYKQFLAQKDSGHFSEVVVDSSAGTFKPSWDPINKPNYQWRFYAEIFAQLYKPSQILMANFVPWGSKNFSQFLKEINALDAELLKRIIDFSRILNQRVIECIKPELVIVPSSICQATLKNNYLVDRKIKNLKSFRVEAKMPFKFTVSEAMIGVQNIKILVSPHPSYTPRIGKEKRADAQQAVINALNSYR